MNRSIRVNADPVANKYAGDDERIVEISSPVGGGLISLRVRVDDDGKPAHLYVELYRFDATVEIVTSKDSAESHDHHDGTSNDHEEDA
jgi:hypothetical protein